MADVKITVRDNGPYRISGQPRVLNTNGEQLPTEEVTALCRCGHSPMKPFCDGTHKSVGFESQPRAGEG